MNRLTFLIFAFLGIIIINSCGRKHEQNLLTGSWEEVWVTQNDSIGEVWTFYESNMFTISKTKNNITTLDTAYYFLEKKTGEVYSLYINDYTSWDDGKHRIITLNKDLLIFQQIYDRAGNYAFNRREFIRK